MWPSYNKKDQIKTLGHLKVYSWRNNLLRVANPSCGLLSAGGKPVRSLVSVCLLWKMKPGSHSSSLSHIEWQRWILGSERVQINKPLKDVYQGHWSGYTICPSFKTSTAAISFTSLKVSKAWKFCLYFCTLLFIQICIFYF